MKLKQEVQTRWNSTFLMFQRFIEVKHSLIMSLSYVNCSESLTADEWDIIQECVKILVPLHELTEELSGEHYSTSSIIIPLVRGCQKEVKASNMITLSGHALKDKLLTSLSLRMTKYKTDEMGICAKDTILDPRLKKYGFGFADNATNTVNQLVQEMYESLDGGVAVASGTGIQPAETEVPEKKKGKRFGASLKNRGVKICQRVKGIVTK